MNVFLVLIALAAPAVAPKAGFETVAAASAAAAPSATLMEVTTVPAAVGGQKTVCPNVNGTTACSIETSFAQTRFLSGPWSAARRLEAAKIRGDAEEARRMEAKKDELLDEALNTFAAQ